MKIIQQIIDWSEVWAPLIPLIFYYIFKPKASWARPVIIYLIIALIFGAALDIIWKRKTLGIDKWFQENLWWWYDTNPKTQKLEFKNTIFYNLLSVARLLMFTWFFNFLGQSFKKLNRFIPPLFLVLAIINFIGFENIKDFSSRQMAVEAAILLFYCLLYFYKVNMEDSVASPVTRPHFWVVTGLTLYTAINFMIFLFYKYLMSASVFKDYAVEVWNVHNISYIILNIFIATAFYRAR